MARPKTHSERMIILERIIGLVKEQGRITTNDVVAMFGVHRTTAEKYLQIALVRGGFIRHGRCGVFRDQRAVIDYDLKRYSCNKTTGFSALRDRIARTVRAALHHDLEKLNQPVSFTDRLPELIEGMEVSIDVSTCNTDAGNRYFDTFDVNGNSPVIPDCSFAELFNSARALLDVLYEFGGDEVAISEYVTNLEDALRVAAAPQQEE